MNAALRKIPSLRKTWSTSSGLARFTMYLAGVEILFFLLQAVFRAFGAARLASTLGTWIALVGVVFVILLIVLGLRWFRRALMWSLRNRLIVTYVFIGVIPVVLLAIVGVITAYLFAGQFAGYVIHSDIRSELKLLQNTSTAATNAIVRDVTSGTSLRDAASRVSLDSLVRTSPAVTVTVIVQPESGAPFIRTVPAGSAPSSIPGQIQTQEVTAPKDSTVKGNVREMLGVAEQGKALYLRAANHVPLERARLYVIASAPLDESLLKRFASTLGELTLFPPDTNVNLANSQATPTSKPGERGSDKLQIHTSGQVLLQNPSTGKLEPSLSPLNAGVLPQQTNMLDREVLFGTLFDVVDWESGHVSPALLGIRTRPSLLYGRLFVAVGDVAQGVVILLIGIAIAFGLIELLALIIGVRLTRTVTRSVYELYSATQRINRGDLSYRIRIYRQDQLAELETSFNSMSQSLERLIAEQKEKQRIESELAIAQEVQAQLFPRDISDLATLDLHGACRPARTVSGDYYDFLPLGDEKLGIAVGDISGKGISAALLMATIHSAVRVYEMGRVPARAELVAAGAAAISSAAGGPSLVPASVLESPGAVLSLLNRHLYHSTPPEKYATMFFALWDGRRRRLAYANGGHLPPIIVRENGSIERLEVGGTVVGLFEEAAYDEATVELRPGDIFVAYSDGVTEPENEFGEFGEERLIDLIRETRHLPLNRITETVTMSVLDWIGAEEQPDDITVVLVRAR